MSKDNRLITSGEDNIFDLREKYKNGLTFVVGDTHGECDTLEALMEKIMFDPLHDRVYFAGDYNGGGNVKALLSFISKYFDEDYENAGFHLIRGNHERELMPLYPLSNMPDIIVLKRSSLNYYIAHAGMVSGAFRSINEDMAKYPGKSVFLYSLDSKSAGHGAPLRQIVWSKNGLYSRKSENRVWPAEKELKENRACIIHAHSPYCFFKCGNNLTYGDSNIFWANQHVFFCEELQSFNIDSNIKGRDENGETYRGLTCVCIEVLEEIAKNMGALTAEVVSSSQNCMFSAGYIPNLHGKREEDVSSLLSANPVMKLITIDENGTPRVK